MINGRLSSCEIEHRVQNMSGKWIIFHVWALVVKIDVVLLFRSQSAWKKIKRFYLQFWSFQPCYFYSWTADNKQQQQQGANILMECSRQFLCQIQADREKCTENAIGVWLLYISSKQKRIDKKNNQLIDWIISACSTGKERTRSEMLIKPY